MTADGHGRAPPAKLPGGPAAHAFFLDLDGTLLEIAEAPDLVRGDARLLETVGRLQQAAAGAVAVVSGRELAAVDRLLAPLRLPAAGQHGVERRDAAGRTHRHSLGEAQLEDLRQDVYRWAAGIGGLRIEDKGLSLAIHYRQVPELAEQIRRTLEEILARTGDAFGVQPGRMVLDVKPAGRDKGSAIREFMAERPFAGRVPVFVGDDATDEHGFAMAGRLGGYGVKVGPGPTMAGFRLADVAAVRGWLESLLAVARR